MIRINLHPESFRRAERTSPKIFASALAGVVLVCSGIGWFGMIYFGDLDKAQAKHRTVADELANAEKQAGYYDKLVAESKDFSKRADTIKGIAKGRMLWTRVLDELIDVVNNDGDTERHNAWFNGMSVRGSPDGRQGPQLNMPGAVEGGDFRKIANLIDDVEATRFFQDINAGIPPAGTKNTSSKLYPPESLVFAWKLQFNPPNEWVKNKVGGKPAK